MGEPTVDRAEVMRVVTRMLPLLIDNEHYTISVDVRPTGTEVSLHGGKRAPMALLHTLGVDPTSRVDSEQPTCWRSEWKIGDPYHGGLAVCWYWTPPDLAAVGTPVAAAASQIPTPAGAVA